MVTWQLTLKVLIRQEKYLKNKFRKFKLKWWIHMWQDFNCQNICPLNYSINFTTYINNKFIKINFLIKINFKKWWQLSCKILSWHYFKFYSCIPKNIVKRHLWKFFNILYFWVRKTEKILSKYINSKKLAFGGLNPQMMNYYFYCRL